MCLALAAGAAHAETVPVSLTPPPGSAAAFGSVATKTAAAAAQHAVHAPATKLAAAGPTITPVAGTSLAVQARNPDLSAFVASQLHTAAPSDPMTAQVMAALAPSLSAPEAAGGTYAAGTAAPSATPSAPVGSDAPAVIGADPKVSTSILDLSPLNRLGGVATGLSTATRLPLPDDAALSRDTAQAIVRAFRPSAGTADQAASDAADDTTTGDPALDERIALARTVFKVDGTDDLIRHFVATQMMKVVIGEVAKHIDINKLSETDKYHLSAVAAAAQTELEEKVLNLDARVEANYLTKQDLTLLVVAYDNDAQRKQTQLRLGDTGRSDRAAALDVTMAQFQIVKTYEGAQ